MVAAVAVAANCLKTNKLYTDPRIKPQFNS